MKKILSINSFFWVLLFVFNSINAQDVQISKWDGKTVEDFTIGDGSVKNPYQIKNANNMAFLCLQSKDKSAKYLKANYKLMINIDWQKAQWNPIGQDGNSKFSGIFDGNGKTIKNVIIVHQWNSMGIFGVLDGTIKNLNVEAKITSTPLKDKPNIGNSYGGICGTMFPHSLIENCSFSGTVSANFDVGGIAGIAWGGNIIGCVVRNSNICSFYNEKNPNSKSFNGRTGGIIGYLSNSEGVGGVIGYCLVENTSINGYSTLTNGIAGNIGSWTTVYNCCTKDLSNKSFDKCNGIIPLNVQLNKKFNYHNFKDGIDYDCYNNFETINNKQLSNLLNGNKIDVDFVPNKKTKWYWKSVNEEFPIPIKTNN